MATKVSSNPSMEITPTQQMVSSCTGAMLTSIFVTPLDVVKIRMQSQQKEFMKNKCFLYCNGLMDHVCYCFNGHGKGNICQLHGKNLNYKNSHSYHSLSVKHLTEQHVKDLWYRRGTPFNGTVDAFVKITKNEGVASLWSGLPPTLVMALPATVMYFTIYDQLVAHLRKVYDTETKRHVWIPAVAGGSARAFSATLISPLEMIRTKMQSQKLSYVELGTALKQLVKNEGAISLWKGLTPTILRDVPFSGLYWLNYENIKNHFNQLNPSFGFSFFAGATSGTVAAIVTLPFDVVKTHKQIELGEIEASAQKTKPKNTLQIMNNIFKQNGVRGLFSGLVPRISKVAPACAIMISTYESGKSFFRSYNESNYKSRISNN